MRYLTLLRGINVSGKNPIKMKEFQAYLQESGFENVKTYIQSGNIVFDDKVDENGAIAKKISDLIKDRYDYDVIVFVLNLKNLKEIIKNNPFETDAEAHPNKVFVSFLSAVPKDELVQKFSLVEYKTEKYNIQGEYAYLSCLEGIGKAKINNNYFESKLKVDATTRNWKTVLKLYEMMQ